MDNKDAKKKALLKVIAVMGKFSADKIKGSKNAAPVAPDEDKAMADDCGGKECGKCKSCKK